MYFRLRIEISSSSTDDFTFLRVKYPSRKAKRLNLGQLQPETNYKFVLQGVVKSPDSNIINLARLITKVSF